MKIRKILVSQPEPTEGEKSPYVQLAKKYNIQIDFHKFFKVQGVTSKEFRQQRIAILDHSAIIFTSRNAVDHLFRLAKENRVEIPDTMKYFCINEATAYYLQKYVQFRKRKIFHGKQTFADLADLIKKNKNEKFLIPCSDISKNDVPNFMEEYGIKYTKAVIYETVANDLSFLNLKEYDLLVFFSPVGIKSLFKNFPDYKQEESLIGAFGATTSKCVTEYGLSLNINAPTVNCPSMTMAIEDYIVNSSKKKTNSRKKEGKALSDNDENAD